MLGGQMVLPTPYNKNKSQRVKNTNTLASAAGGALLGSCFGPGGA